MGIPSQVKLHCILRLNLVLAAKDNFYQWWTILSRAEWREKIFRAFPLRGFNRFLPNFRKKWPKKAIKVNFGKKFQCKFFFLGIPSRKRVLRQALDIMAFLRSSRSGTEAKQERSEKSFFSEQCEAKKVSLLHHSFLPPITSKLSPRLLKTMC